MKTTLRFAMMLAIVSGGCSDRGTKKESANTLDPEAEKKIRAMYRVIFDMGGIPAPDLVEEAVRSSGATPREFVELSKKIMKEQPSNRVGVLVTLESYKSMPSGEWDRIHRRNPDIQCRDASCWCHRKGPDQESPR